MRRNLIAILMLISIFVTVGCEKQDKNVNNENEQIEDIAKFEPIGCYRFKDSETGLYGYMDGKGNIIIEPKYVNATDFEYGLCEYAKAYDGNKTVTIIDKKGKEYLPFGKYTSVSLPQNDLIVFQENTSKYGVIDINDKIILEPIYDKIEIGDLGSIVVTLNNKNGAFDRNGDKILDIVYDYIYQVNNSFIVKKEDKDGLFNIEGKEVLPIQYESVQIAHTIGQYDNEVFQVMNSNSKIGFFNDNGKQLTDFIYDEVMPGRDGLIPVLKNNKWGYIDIEGNIAIPFQFDSASSFSDKKSMVEINNEKKYINTKGEFIEEEEVSYKFDIKEYEFIVPLSSNLFMVSESKDDIKIKIVDKKGNLVSDDIYLYAIYYDEFNKVLARKENGQYSILNEKGEKILDIEEDASDVRIFEDDLIRVEFNQENFKWINSKGKVLP